MAGFVERVAAEAPKVRPIKILLTVFAAPFYAIGWLLGLLLVGLAFMAGAVKLGIAEGKARAGRPAAAPAPVAPPAEGS